MECGPLPNRCAQVEGNSLCVNHQRLPRMRLRRNFGWHVEGRREGPAEAHLRTPDAAAAQGRGGEGVQTPQLAGKYART
jgi:hypothetical protein